MSETVYTIGHSNHPAERFIDLLSAHGIVAVCDVRSTPYSQFTPQFNRSELKHLLPQYGIRYIFLGAELGARSDDRACYTNGKINYQLLSGTPLFQSGLARIQEGLKKNFRIALMCAEKEPLECHRFVLVSRALATLGLEVQHIHADGSLESHADALVRLADLVHVPEADLFRSAEELRDEAYYRQELRIAYEAEPAEAIVAAG